MTDPQPFRRSDDFEQLPYEGQRVRIAPHLALDKDGSHRYILPASRLSFGDFQNDANGDLYPVLIMGHDASANSLSYVFTPDELRLFARKMLDRADKMEAAAADQLAQTLAKRGGQG